MDRETPAFKKQFMVKIAVLLGFFALSFSFAPAASACTLWGAAGEKTEGGGTLIAKNRDWTPTQVQDVRRVVPKEGFRYLGLFATDEEGTGLKAGVNEHGLVVVTATASVVPGEKRGNPDRKSISSAEILKTCSTVEEVVALLDRFTHASYYLVADHAKLAVIEVGPGGKATARITENGTLAQTNHYLNEQLRILNKKVSKSSRARYDRIRELLSKDPDGFSLDDFVAFSEDKNAGPDNSICRTGSNPTRSRTLATWIIENPASGAPLLYLKVANPNEPERTIRLSLDESFWRGKPRGDKAAGASEEKPTA
ncbi:MAG: C45 family autoproteolytic acyltransferase/hydrolase [Synergistales bacterium]|jgi:isopenicillin-N N-acyltransferase-like protein